MYIKIMDVIYMQCLCYGARVAVYVMSLPTDGRGGYVHTQRKTGSVSWIALL